MLQQIPSEAERIQTRYLILGLQQLAAHLVVQQQPLELKQVVSGNILIKPLKRWIYETKGFFQFEIIINVLFSSPDSFEYLCYGFTAIRNIFTFTVQGSILVVRIRRLQTSKVDPRAVRVKVLITSTAIFSLLFALQTRKFKGEMNFYKLD